MKIVLDTKSKGWAAFVRIFQGILILICVIMVVAIIEAVFKIDLQFFAGYSCAFIIYKYKWRV